MTAPERIWAWTYKLPYNRKDGTRSWVPFAPQFKPWVINDWPGWKFWQTRRTEYYQSATEYIRADLARPTLSDALHTDATSAALDRVRAEGMREANTAHAKTKLAELCEWLEEDEDNGTLLLLSLSEETLTNLRAILAAADKMEGKA